MDGTGLVGAGEGLGEAIRQHRHHRAMSQHQLALRLGVTQQSVARWEHGLAPRRDLIARIQEELTSSATEADALGRVIKLHRAAELPDEEGDRQQRLRDEFIEGCVDIVRRGHRLPDDLMVHVARRLGVFADDAN